MILRQIVGRHGRTVLSRSTPKRIQKTYATTIDLDHPANQQSERDHSPSREIPGHSNEASSVVDASQRNPFDRSWGEITEALLSSFNQIVASTQHQAIQHGGGLKDLSPEEFFEHTQKDTEKIKKALTFLHAKINGLKQDEHWVGFAQEAIAAGQGCELFGPLHYLELLQKETQRTQYETNSLASAIEQRRLLGEEEEAKAIEQHRLLEEDEGASQTHDLTSTDSNPFASKAEPLYDENALPRGHTPLWAFKDSRFATRELRSNGSIRTDVYQPWQILTNPPNPEDLTLSMLLANQTHLGHATSLWHPSNSSYIFGIRQGIHVISLDITLSYLRRAAKVVQEVARRGGIILFIGTRDGHREIVVNSAKLAEPAYHIFSRWIPGSLTNGQQILGDCALKVVNAVDSELEQYRHVLGTSTHAALRPDLVICLNPRENEVCLHECGLYNVPTIGIVDTDTNPSWVTYPVPANDDSLRSVALVSGVLARAAQRGQTARMEMAREGKTTYNTMRVERALLDMEEIAKLDVQTRGNSEKASEKDVD